MEKEHDNKWRLGFLRDLARQGSFISGLTEKREKKEDSVKLDKEEIIEGRGLAILAYVPFLCFIPFLSGKKNRFAYEHGKIGLALFLFELLIFLIVVFWKLALFVSAIVALVGVFYALQGKIWRIPFISEISDRFDILD